MIPNSQNKITNVQASVAVFMTIMGVGVISLPMVSAEAVKTPDIWLSVIMSGFIAMIFAFFVVSLGRKFPRQTFYQYSRHITGKPIGFLLNLTIASYFITLSGYEVRAMAEVIRGYLLDQTPIEVTMSIFISVGVYLVVGGIKPIVKLFELYFPIILVFFLFMFILSYTNFEVDNVRPVLGDGIRPIIQGIKPTALSYFGFEIMFILTAYMDKPQKALYTTLMGIGLTMVIYLIMLVLVIGALTVEEVRLLTFPTMELVKSIELKGFFLERFETFFIIMWVITTFTTFTISLYIASLGWQQTFNKNCSTITYVLIPVIYLAAMYPQDINSVFKYGDYVGYFGILVSGIFPLSLWLITLVKKKSGKAISEES